MNNFNTGFDSSRGAAQTIHPDIQARPQPMVPGNSSLGMLPLISQPSAHERMAAAQMFSTDLSKSNSNGSSAHGKKKKKKKNKIEQNDP